MIAYFVLLLHDKCVMLAAQLCATNNNNNNQKIQSKTHFSLSFPGIECLSQSQLNSHRIRCMNAVPFHSSKNGMCVCAVAQANCCCNSGDHLLFLSHVTLSVKINMCTSTFLRLLSQSPFSTNTAKKTQINIYSQA